jgi:hypothetical protein
VIELLYALHGSDQRLRIQQVAFYEFHIHTLQRRPVFPWHNHDPNIIASFKAQPGYVVANEACSASNEHFAHSHLSFQWIGLRISYQSTERQVWRNRSI